MTVVYLAGAGGDPLLLVAGAPSQLQLYPEALPQSGLTPARMDWWEGPASVAEQ